MRPKMQLSPILLLLLWILELSSSQAIPHVKKQLDPGLSRDRMRPMSKADDTMNSISQQNLQIRQLPIEAVKPTYFASNQSQAVERNARRPTNEKNGCPSTTADCLCDADKPSENIIKVNLKTISIIDPKSKNKRCFADEDPLVACENRKCVIIPNNNFEILFQKGKRMNPSNYLDNTKELDSPPAIPATNFSRKASGPIILDTLFSAYYPVEYTYPRAIGEGGHFRAPRSAYGSNMCRVPSLANSEVTCWKWPNWQTCKQTCIYGHGMDNSGKTIREKSFNCRNSENKWKPHIIRDCEPFINCKVHLKSPGDLNCVEPTDGPAYCDINCADYDDYKSSGKVRWKCEEKAAIHGKDGKGNRLPHCAEFEEAELRLAPPDY